MSSFGSVDEGQWTSCRGSLRINVTVASKQSGLYCLSDFVGFGLPGAETDCRDLVPCVKGLLSDGMAICMVGWRAEHRRG
ncbi:hypothetical protein TMatcc_000593 [Talaromyces marneffei ATCC 18224]